MPRRLIGPGRSCLECRRRKIRCDRCEPCSYCTAFELVCHYPPSEGVKPRSEPVEAIQPGDKDEIVTTLESAVVTLQRQVSEIQAQLGASPPPLLDGVSNGNVTNRRGPRQISLVPPDVPRNLTSFHPPATKIITLWQIYLDIVDPVLKFFHVPTMQQRILNAIKDLANLDAATECLLFSIYYSAVMATPAPDCQRLFQQPKSSLVRRYREAVEAALARANLLRTQETTVLQAFTLYLTVSRRDEDPPDHATLMAVAVGAGLRMGLNQIDSMPMTTPFEREILRRLWWLLVTLDTRISEDYNVETALPDRLCTTRMLTNVNDCDLHPDMMDEPREALGSTESLYCIVRCSATWCMRDLVLPDAVRSKRGLPPLSTAEKLQALDAWQAETERTTLTKCDLDSPIGYVSVHSVRLVMGKVKLGLSKPVATAKQDKSLRKAYRTTCLEMLGYAASLRDYEQGRKWLWLFQTYIEWDALAYLLLDLCLSPKQADLYTTWPMVDRIYNHWSNDPDAPRTSRWENIEELRKEAGLVRQRLEAKVQTSHVAPTSDASMRGYPVPESQMVGDTVTSAGSGSNSTTPINALWSNAVESTPMVGVDATGAMMCGNMPQMSAVDEWSALLFDCYWHAVEP